MTRSRVLTLLLAAGTTASAVLIAPGAAQAGGGDSPPAVKLLDSTVAAPFQLDVSQHRLYVADGGTAKVSRFTSKGLRTVAKGPAGGEVAGVAINRRGDLAYTSSVFGKNGAVQTRLTIKRKGGGTVVADLLAYEKAHNPDAKIRYGIDNPTACQRQAFAPLGGATTKGGIDSHPYAVAPLGDRAWVVADAGGNDLLKVSGTGKVSTLALLPRQATTITADAAAALGLPDCVVGAVYNFEPVPTDIEYGRHGAIVSLLPGGPEDPSLGARGSVYRVDLRSGKSQLIAGGFLGATNVAVTSRGAIFVAELFAGRISVIRHGEVKPYVDLPNALSLTWDNGTLYAGTLGPSDDQGNPTGPGSLVAIR